MGNESSKPAAVEPPPEWEPASNAKKFELVSPMSDLSDPSMFLHRRPHPKLSDATVQQIAGKKQTRKAREPPARLASLPEHRKGPVAAARQTPAGDRRRKSKVITRDSAYKHEPRPRELAPPSAFYFPNVPTRESEENLNRLSVRKSSATGVRRQSNATKSNDADDKEKDEENKENNLRKNTPLLKKAKRKVNRARTCLTGCFEESGHNMKLMKDNAKLQTTRGERLSSEAGTDKVEGLLKVDENPELEKEFDPYQEDPLPKSKSTVLQFIDGSEKELAFNPVWRESHDGTYHSDPSSTGTSDPRRASDFVPAKASSKGSSRRASDPLSQANTSYPTKQYYTSAEGKAKNDQVPNPPGDQQERFKEDQKQSIGTLESSQPRQSVETSTASKDTKSRESASSSATSHESSYWNGFYKEAQVLHHEDAYFDRIAFAPNKAMPEPSPMAANTSTATPVVALFGQNNQKSLLGSMDASDVDEEKLGPSDSPSKLSRRSSNGQSDMAGPSQGERDDTSMSRSSKRMSESSKTTLHEEDDGEVNSGKEDIVPKGSRADTASLLDHPSDENFGGLIKKNGTEDTCTLDEETTRSGNSNSVDDVDQPEDEQQNTDRSKASRDSFLDQRTTADKILVQTSLVTKMPSNQGPNRDSIDTKAAPQATPQSTVLERRSSIGSAFSYKDKDVFTPVTSLTTYPKGSPFRPRVSINEKAMAKANLNQPVMLTQSFDNRSRCSRDMEIQATESAPSMIESHDYRDIALGCFLDDSPNTNANKKERALALASPGVMSLESPMSTGPGMSPAQPLLSNQVVNNAAFLFSPSYATGIAGLAAQASTDNASQYSDQLSRIESKPQGSSFSICTLGSRSRLTGRSKKSIRIPFSSTGSLQLIKSGSRKSSVSDASSRQKSVRFSEGGQSVSESVAESESASQKSRRSVTWDFNFKAAPDNVDIPAIETKVSDLSDTMFGRDPSPVGSTTKRESVDSAKSELREATIEEESETETASLTSSSETVSRQSLASTKASREASRSSFSTTGTPEQQIRTWTYCEFSKGVTPLLDKRQLSQATNSPVLRFKAAKNKFLVAGQEKEVPVKRSSPSFYKRNFGTGRVHSLAAKFDNGIELRESAWHTANERPATTSLPGLGERPMLRTPQIVGYTPKSFPNIYQRASIGSHSTSANHSQTSKPAATAFQMMQMRTMSADASVSVSTRVDEIPEEYSDDASQQSNTAKSVPSLYHRASIGSHSTSANHSQTSKPAATTFQMMQTRTMSADASVSPRVNEIPEEDSDDASQQSTESNGSSTFVQSVATLRQDRHMLLGHGSVNVIEEDREVDRLDEVLDNILSSESTDSQDDARHRDDLPCDEAADDFAELLLNNILGAPSQDECSVATATESRPSMKIVKSISWEDEENSTFTNILSAPTFSDESTTMSSVLAQQTTANLRHGAKTVQPHVQQLKRQEGVPTQQLHLSPLQRTPMQASKWRELAERAQNQDKHKKSIFRSASKKKKTGLSERNTNIA